MILLIHAMTLLISFKIPSVVKFSKSEHISHGLKAFKQSLAGNIWHTNPFLKMYIITAGIYNNNKGKDEGNIQIISFKKHINLYEVLS